MFAHFRCSPRSLAALLVSFIILIPSSAEAQRVRGIARIGLENGGEKVLQFQYSDGSSPDVTAGGGLLLTGGVLGRLVERPAGMLDVSLQAGLKYRTVPPANNQEVTWLRFPVEALIHASHPKGLGLAAGATVHLANELKASGDVLNDRVKFKSTPGWILQVQYAHRNTTFDLRYTLLDYEVESGGSGTVGASSIGLGVSFLFGRKATAE